MSQSKIRFVFIHLQEALQERDSSRDQLQIKVDDLKNVTQSLERLRHELEDVTFEKDELKQKVSENIYKYIQLPYVVFLFHSNTTTHVYRSLSCATYQTPLTVTKFCKS